MASLIPSVIAFAGGIIWALTAGVSALPPLWSLLALAALAIAMASLRGRRTTAFLLAIPFFFLLGCLRAAPTAKSPSFDPAHVAHLITDRREATVEGTLVQSPVASAGRWQLLLDSHQLLLADGTSLATHGLVRLSLPGIPDGIRPGDRILARAVLDRPRNFATPGAFDYRQYLAAQSIWVVGWVGSQALVARLRPLAPPQLWQRFATWPEQLRQRIGTFLDQHLDRLEAGLYRALLIGDRSGLSPSLQEQFTRTGAVHLLAISGMHMGLIALITVFLFNWLLKRSTWLLLRLPAWKFAAILALLPLTGYALIAGLHPPAVRALVMTAIFFIAVVVDRRWSIPTNIAIAALILLAAHPMSIASASFQLSFAAVISIALLYPEARNLFTAPPAQGRVSVLGNRLLAGLAISVAASVGTLPLLLLHFNRFSLLSPLSTLLIEPFLCFWALPLGLLGCLAIPLSPALAVFILNTGGIGLTAADRLSGWLARIPFICLRLPTPTWPEIALFYLTLIGFGLRRRHRLALPMSLLAALGLVGVTAGSMLNRIASQDCRVTVLDVGHGAAALLELPHGHAILIDGGSYQGERFDVGERVIAPFLWRRRVLRLDAVVVSHPHSDHYNGLPFVLRNFHPAVLWVNGSPGGGPEYKALLKEAAGLGIAVRVPTATVPLYQEGMTRLTSLADPLSRLPASRHQGWERPGSDENRHSLVLRLDCGRRAFLFPADIDAVREGQLERTEAERLAVDVLVAPHHGSVDAMGEGFRRATSPSYLVISAGASRGGAAERPAVLEPWRAAGVSILTTAEEGTISFTTDGAGLAVATAKPAPTAQMSVKSVGGVFRN